MKIIYSDIDDKGNPCDWSFPDSVLQVKNLPFFYPDFSQEVRATVCWMVRVDKVGKCIENRFASRHYHEATMAFDITACDLLQSNPMQARCFDASLVVGQQWIAAEQMPAEMKEAVDAAINRLSQYMTLKTGDLLLVPTTQRDILLHQGIIQVAEYQAQQLAQLRVV